MSQIVVDEEMSPPLSSNVRKLVPTAKLPAAATFQRLSECDQQILEKRLSEPVECVYHPMFRRATMPQAPTPRVPDDHVLVALERGAEQVGHPAQHQATEVLTAEDERALFFRFNYCRNRTMQVLRKFRGRRLTVAAVGEVLRWEKLAQETRTDIIRANTSLVLAMARRSRNTGVELGELVSEGNLALLRCVDKFDASRGFKFSTYACRAILASFSRAGAKAARHRVQFPTPYDPAMERSDYVETRRELIEHECVEELRRILFDNSAELSTVERRVLTARFSLDQPNPKTGTRRKTLDQVGDLLGVSKERVRQIQNQAMIKIRAVLEERLLAAS
jgi:RNA polymerase sigma factor (sigma-70 family)